jgi:hypothetical protein
VGHQDAFMRMVVVEVLADLLDQTSTMAQITGMEQMAVLMVEAVVVGLGEEADIVLVELQDQVQEVLFVLYGQEIQGLGHLLV